MLLPTHRARGFPSDSQSRQASNPVNTLNPNSHELVRPAKLAATRDLALALFANVEHPQPPARRSRQQRVGFRLRRSNPMRNATV